MIHNSHPNANYFEKTYVKSQSVNVPHTPDTSVSLPNPNVNSTYELQEQLTLTNSNSYNPLIRVIFISLMYRRAQRPLLNNHFSEMLLTILCSNHFFS